MRNYFKICSVLFCTLLLIAATTRNENNTKNLPIQSFSDSVKIDSKTGLIVAEGLDLVTAHCTGCHSSKLITQFHTDRKGWLEKIRWMQKNQKLWDLGEAEPKVLDYLEKNYSEIAKPSRRAAPKNIEWYQLKN